MANMLYMAPVNNPQQSARSRYESSSENSPRSSAAKNARLLSSNSLSASNSTSVSQCADSTSAGLGVGSQSSGKPANHQASRVFQGVMLDHSRQTGSTVRFSSS